MTIKNPALLQEIDGFLTRSGMGEKYFGKASVGNSEVVTRLRNGGRVWPETEIKIRTFIAMREKSTPTQRLVSSSEDVQPSKQKPAGATQ